MTATKRTGRKAKRKPVSLAGAQGKMVLAIQQVDDPYEAGAKCDVLRNVTRSPLASIFDRGRLRGNDDTVDDAAARLVAGERFRALYERAELAGAGAVDYSAVKVDVSFAYSGPADKMTEAHMELGRICAALGRHYGMVRAVVGEERPFFVWLASHVGREPSRSERMQAYDDMRAALDELIQHFGVAKGRAKRAAPYIRTVKPWRGKIEIEDLTA